jgi:CubicO group peptidase (beta-lactamase class C family)
MPAKPLDGRIADRLQTAIDLEVAQGTPDVIAAVVTAEGMWAGAAGIDGPNGRKAQPTDEFGIASVSKLLLAALVLKLAEEGKLELDAPLADYLDGLEVDANGGTVRQALAMRSGIGAALGDVVGKAFSACDRPWSTADVLATVPRPFGPAGSRYEYSNPTYKLVGIAAENASGMKLADALKSLVIDQADADRMLLQGPDATPPKPWALPVEGHGSGYDIAKFGTGGNLPCVGDTTLTRGAGAVASDAPTLARWGWALFAGSIISAESLNAMTTMEDGAHGLGIDRFSDFAPEVAYGHSGSQPGYSALLAVLPHRPAVVVVFINDESADPYAGVRHLLDALDG